MPRTFMINTCTVEIPVLPFLLMNRLTLKMKTRKLVMKNGRVSTIDTILLKMIKKRYRKINSLAYCNDIKDKLKD